MRKAERDPLYIEEFNNMDRLTQIESLYLCSGADGLDDLIQQTYSTFPWSFSKQVPQSAYAYYIAVLCYARLLNLNGGCYKLDELELVEMVRTSKFSVPKSVGMYLAGFGCIDHSDFGKVLFKMKKPTLTSGGYFGSIKDNMYAYASYPCPGVYAKRVINDTEMNGDDGSWDLPNEYRYEGHSLTEKCLGYKKSTALTSQQQDFLRRYVSDRKLPHFENVPFNIELMLGVSAHLNQVPGIKLVNISDEKRGSLGQTIIVRHTEDKSCRYVSSSAFKPCAHIEHFGFAFRYCVDKGRKQFTDNQYKTLLPVLFTEDQEVPEGVNINILYELNNWHLMKCESYTRYANSFLIDTNQIDF